MGNLQVGQPIKLTIQKFDPSRDSAPYDRTYTVPYTREMRVLEALDYVVEELGESLAYQWFCGVKKCGMCGVTVNGRQALACWEPVEPEMVIHPLPNFPVIRDLVIDRERYVKNVLALAPAMQRKSPYSGFPEPTTGKEMEGAAEMMHCIECMLCVSACPAYSVNFMGPAPLVQLARYALDPRDAGERARTALETAGIEHCVSCYQCSRVCPTNIPIFKLAIEGLRQQIRQQHLERPKSLRSRAFANVHALSRFGSRLAPLSNWLGRSRPVRWAAEKALGIDQRRPLPSFARMSFDRWFKERDPSVMTGPLVVLFHDTFMTYYEPEIGIAATRLLEAAGYRVILVENRKCCGRPMLSKGFVDQAQANARYNVDLLAPYARDGLSIVGCEPSCVLTIREEYPKLVGEADAKLVAEHTWTFEEFLARRTHEGGFGPLFSSVPRKILVHGHCHEKAIIGIGPTLKALGLLDGCSVEEIPSTCCGMAGSNGFECEHYERSLQAGEVALFPTVRQAPADAEIVAAGVSCRQQIAHATGRKARHSAQVLLDALVEESVPCGRQTRGKSEGA